MKHLIIGTAGHIDHGKTTLIRAITGRNTDRLKEEQERGISIELGFTYFDLPSGQRAGIIDVPGHEKFIKNMLAGVIGIDIVLLVVAADEGTMPQTIEHLHILDLLGIKRGFIVMTKTDLVDGDWMDMVEEDIREEVGGTFLEGAPIIRVSSTNKSGIDQVIGLIDSMTGEMEEKNERDMPRLPVDRVFSISGFGTVVTGTLLSGQFNLGDEVQIFPGDKVGRIRNLQVHDKDAERAHAGQRVAVNLAGLKKDEIDRGDILAPIGSLTDTMMLDVKIKLLKSIDRTIDNRTRLRLYIGTREILCRIVLLDKEEIGPGDEAYAQLRLEEEVVAKRGDKFILRFYSPMFTIGGGEVLEPNPKKKKRFDEKAIKELEIKEMGSSTDIIEKIIEDDSKFFPTTKEIASKTSMLEDNIREEVTSLIDQGKVIGFQQTKDLHIIHKNYYNEVTYRILQELDNYHKKYPLRIGMSKEEIRARHLKAAKPKVAESFIDLMISEGKLEQSLENLQLKDFSIKLDSSQDNLKNKILDAFEKASFQPPKKEELKDVLKEKEELVSEMFIYLVNKGDIVKVNEEVYLTKNKYTEALDILYSNFKGKDNIVLGDYRDLLNTNRKVAISLLEFFDQQKITKRDKDNRVLTKV